MANEDFVEEFMEQCIAKGIKSQKDICSVALQEMQENDEKIRQSNKLRVRNKNLTQVLRELGHESVKKPKVNTEIKVYEDLNTVESSAYITMMINICDYMERNIDKAVTSRDIINGVGAMGNDTEVYTCIKTLYDNGILARSGDKERTIVLGANWEKRPKVEELHNKSA